MSTILLIPASDAWRFEPDAVIERLRDIWPAATVNRAQGDLFEYQFWLEGTGLLVGVGGELIEIETSTGMDESARVAYESVQTAPGSLGFHFMDEGNSAHLLVTRETPLSTYQRLPDADPLSS